MKRAKRGGYLRNVAVALGNSGEPAAVRVLQGALESDPEPLVRGHSAWALGKLGTAESRRALDSALYKEKDPQVLAEIQSAFKIR
ncbi:MAG: hypothetical protein A2Z49_12850 [Chloroflexi bacterium RBG_19FT_COMBO_56_12]|nr:MAG: hypothetical protein A2Z49_12850 [Chloroflexi bacterium RBG_19FT_COMBO_56_12]